MHVADEEFCQGMAVQGLCLHHLQTDIVSLHLLQIFHLGRTDHFAEQQQHFRLSVCERVSFDVVAVEVEIEHKLALETLFVFRQKGVHRQPLLIEFRNLFHSFEYLMPQSYKMSWRIPNK